MITVVLADDHRLFREGLQSLLQAETDLQVVGEAEDGRAAYRLARELAPDVLVLDITMPGLNGIDACRQITAETATRVVALSMHSGQDHVVAMFRAGASGYVLKDTASEELVAAIRAAAAGERYACRQLLGTVLDDYAGRLVETSPQEHLTARQREVLQLLAEGQTSKAIAAALHLSVRTVDSYRAQIMEKLGLDNVADLTKYAIRQGLTGLDD